MSSGPGGRANFWDTDFRKERTDFTSSPNPSGDLPNRGSPAAYEPFADSAVLTPTTSASPSAYIPTYQAPSSRLHEDLETLSQLDPLLHPALNQPSVEEPPSPPGTSLVISSPRAAGYSNVLSIRPSADVATAGVAIILLLSTGLSRVAAAEQQVGERVEAYEGLQLEGLLSINARVQDLESRLQHLEKGAQQAPPAEAYLQKSIDAQQAILYKLCSGIDKLATASTTAAATAAGAAVATVSATTSLAAAADSAAEAATKAKETAVTSAEALQHRLSSRDSVARAVIESAVHGVSSGTACVLRGMAKVANEADLVAALLCHKVLLSDYKCQRDADGKFQYMTVKCAKRGAMFLAAVELAWMISDNAIKTMPGALQYLLNPILRPARFCASHARWLGWLAFSYLTVRSLQQGCHHLARLASDPTPPGTPTGASKELHSTSSSELDAAVSNALAPVGDKCPHCSSTSCHGCCGGPGKAPKVIQVPGWLMTPPMKTRAKKRKGPDEIKLNKPKKSVQIAPDPPYVYEDTKSGSVFEELEPDLDVKYAKAVKHLARAAGSASVWLINNLYHVMDIKAS